jgi:FMN-dependent NADH-azoreductase
MQTILQLNSSVSGTAGQSLQLAERSLEQQRYVVESDVLVDELRKVDTILLGLPMHDFGLRDVEFIHVEGLALGAEQRVAAIERALERIRPLAALTMSAQHPAISQSILEANTP